MPSWRGWNEQEVRGSQSTMGFTAINTASTRPSRRRSTTSQSELNAANPNTTARSMASEYLGQGVPEPAIATKAPPKKTNAKGKKHAAPAGESSKSKRRRTSSVKDGMSVTKSAAHSGPDMTTDENAYHIQRTKPAKPRKKTPASKPAQTPAGVSKDIDTGSSLAANSIQIYAPITSMDALDSTSVRTSFDFVRASQGHGFTMYQNPSSSAAVSSGVQFSQPWLNTALANAQAGPTANSATGGLEENADFDGRPSPEETGTSHDTATKRRVCEQSPTPQRQASSTASAGKKKTTVSSKKSSALSRQTSGDMSSETEPGTGLRRSTRIKKHMNPAPVSSSLGTHQGTGPFKQQSDQGSNRRVDADDFSDIEDDDLVDFAKTVEDAIESRHATPPPRGRKQNMREVDENEDYGGALLSDADRQILEKIEKIRSNREDTVKPIVRPPFPTPVLDRSPIFGASQSAVLRTCFRVGEALKAGSQAVRCNDNVVLEVYARVTSSWREPNPGRKQHFVFKDLYHDNPPHLEGTFELWDQARLWDLDSNAFVEAKGQGMMARVIGKMKRDVQKWRLEILSIWEATWEDVNYVAGILAGDVDINDG